MNFLRIGNIRKFILIMVHDIFCDIRSKLKITEIIFRMTFGIFAIHTEIQEFSLSMISVIFAKIENGKFSEFTLFIMRKVQNRHNYYTFGVLFNKPQDQ